MKGGSLFTKFLESTAMPDGRHLAAVHTPCTPCLPSSRHDTCYGETMGKLSGKESSLFM